MKSSLNEEINKDNKHKLTVNVTSKQVYRRNILMRVTILSILILLLLLSILYAIIYIVNTTGNFTISLDPLLKASKNISVSQYRDFHETSLVLEAKALKYMDNITESWLPADIDDKEGPHNGNNYLAYTFWVKNGGEITTSYRAVVDVVAVIKDVDDAIRVGIYFNGKKTVYAKKSNSTDAPEPGTEPFVSSRQVTNNLRSDFKPGDIDRYTIVVWLEGNDPECVNDIIGGEMRLIMSIGEDRLD